VLMRWLRRRNEGQMERWSAFGFFYIQQVHILSRGSSGLWGRDGTRICSQITYFAVFREKILHALSPCIFAVFGLSSLEQRPWDVWKKVFRQGYTKERRKVGPGLWDGGFMRLRGNGTTVM